MVNPNNPQVPRGAPTTQVQLHTAALVQLFNDLGVTKGFEFQQLIEELSNWANRHEHPGGAPRPISFTLHYSGEFPPSGMTPELYGEGLGFTQTDVETNTDVFVMDYPGQGYATIAWYFYDELVDTVTFVVGWRSANNLTQTVAQVATDMEVSSISFPMPFPLRNTSDEQVYLYVYIFNHGNAVSGDFHLHLSGVEVDERVAVPDGVIS